MRSPRRTAIAFLAIPVIAALASVFSTALASATSGPPLPGTGGSVHLPRRTPAARLSGPYERMLRDEMAYGRVLPDAIVARFGLDRFDPDAEAGEAGPAAPYAAEGIAAPAVVSGAPDVQLNNKAGDATCSACGNRPLSQAETSIATLGTRGVASWNNAKGFCPPNGAIQGYATTTDGGATWLDRGDVPALPAGGRYRGDPVVALNRTTGSFYILGLYEFPANPAQSGLALLRGHFSGTTWIIDSNVQIAAGGANFLDKPWIAVDSGSGNIYVSYSNFVGGNTSQIELIRSTDNGVTWSAPLVLNAPASNGNVQGSRPAVGPGGEVYVIWNDYGNPQSRNLIRRSLDGGATFGVEHTVDLHYENGYSGAPGFRRGFGVPFPGIAVDLSAGAHRGRIYAAWDEAVDFYDAPAPTGPTVNEVESNDFFSSATAFTLGAHLSGSMSSVNDVDMWRFSGVRGQTVLFYGSAAAPNTGLNMRLVCDADTSNINNYRFLAYNQDVLPTLVFTLPRTGTYYLRLTSALTTVGTYTIESTIDTPTAGERARDHRDRFVSHSDDGGATWSTPVRLNDDDPWFDGVYPELTVDGRGDVHCFWHDFRDDPGCGALSYEYMTSSGDGGNTWGANRRVSDAQSFWSINVCGSANQGDYQGITADGFTVYPCWSDSRLGDPDVFSEAARFQQALICPGDTTVASGSSATVTFRARNAGTVVETMGWNVTDSGAWLTGATPAASGSAATLSGDTLSVRATFQVPANCSSHTDTVRFIVNDLSIPGRADTCVMRIACQPVSGVGETPPPVGVLLFATPHPSPASRSVQLDFNLPAPGPTSLALFSVNGARVRVLADETLAAGPHRFTWDLTDAGGRPVAAGIYFARLTAAGGQRVQRVLVAR